MSQRRTDIQKEVVEALVSSKAVDFDAIGTVFSKFAARAATNGDSIGVIVNWRVMDICIPVDFYDLVRGFNVDRLSGGQTKV